MTRIFLTIIIATWLQTSYGQSDTLQNVKNKPVPPTNIGSILVGGNLSANLSNNYQQIGSNQAVAGDKVNTYNLNGYIGFFTAPFLAFGGVLYVNYQELRQNNNLFASSSYGLGAFTRPYFYLTNQLPLILHAEFTIGISQSGSSTNTITRIGVGPGVAYFIKKNVSLELLLLYRYEAASYSLGNNNQVINYSNNFNPSLGFQIYFHNK